MVAHINFAVDDDLADHAKDIKDERDLSWPEFLELAVEMMERSDVK